MFYHQVRGFPYLLIWGPMTSPKDRGWPPGHQKPEKRAFSLRVLDDGTIYFGDRKVREYFRAIRPLAVIQPD